jgi:hypothetical protein
MSVPLPSLGTQRFVDTDYTVMSEPLTTNDYRFDGSRLMYQMPERRVSVLAGLAHAPAAYLFWFDADHLSQG